MMLKRLSIAVLLLCLSVPVLAEPPVPMLWRASGEHGVVYLLGSFHLLKPSDYPLAEEVEAAYRGADRLVFEIAPELMDSPELMTRFAERGTLPQGQTLSSVLQPDTVEKLVEFLGSKAALSSVESVKPWFLSIVFAISAMQAAGFDADHGLDQHFMDRAAADGKPTAGLESVDEQIDALDGAPLAEQEIALRDVLKPLPELTADIHELHGAWRSGDESKIADLVLADMAARTPVTARIVNADRNRRWVPQILAMLSTPGTSLVVVGALHLVGEDGVPALLGAEGIEVERVGSSGVN